jgi:DNA-directed RNA polymerase subunit RPC12/RpoP
MDTSTMKYPFGKCANCGKEFNSELRGEYNITHCPWCGDKIDDCFISPPQAQDEIYCEECGKTIYRDGIWLTIAGEKNPGVCTGPCERELCGNCGEWDKEGCCPSCHEEKQN